MGNALTAPDGWTMRYDPDEECIFYTNAEGVPQYHWSGEVDGSFYEKQREQFLQEHGEKQLQLL